MNGSRSRCAVGAAVLALALAGCATSTDGTRIVPSGSRSSNSGASAGPSAPITSRSASASTHAAGYTDPAAVAAVLTAARRAVVVTNSYDYRQLPQFRARALGVATGTFRARFLRSYDALLVKSAPGIRQVQRLTVVSAGLDGMSDADSATVLVTSKIAVHNTTTAHRVDRYGGLLTMQRVSGKWLLADIVTVATSAGLPAAGALGAPGPLPGTAGLRTAAAAAVTTVRAISTLDYRTFDADYDRALALTSGALHADMASHRSQIRRAVLNGRHTLSVRSLSRGVVSVQPDEVVLLFTFETGYGNGDPTPQRLTLTETRVQARWLATDITAID